MELIYEGPLESVSVTHAGKEYTMARGESKDLPAELVEQLQERKDFSTPQTEPKARVKK